MKILAIETTTKNLGIAIADERSILAEYKGSAVLRHSQDLIPNIDKLLKKIKLNLRDIAGFAVSIGPGSFTGLRVGVSVLKGLNLVTGIPIVSVPTLDAIACNLAGSQLPIAVIMDARKNNLYASLYKSKKDGIIKIWDYLLIAPRELISKIDKKTLFTGDGTGVYKRFIADNVEGAEFAEEKYWYPYADVVARLGIEKFKKREFEDPDTITPLYIYSKECNIKTAEPQKRKMGER